MPQDNTGSFFVRIRQKLFSNRINWEIFERIFPHHRGEKNHGYSFDTRQEMIAQTEQLDMEGLLKKIERHIGNMPDAYGESFRYVMHRDLQQRLRMYEKVASCRVRRPCDPRFIATRLETSQ